MLKYNYILIKKILYNKLNHSFLLFIIVKLNYILIYIYIYAKYFLFI